MKRKTVLTVLEFCCLLPDKKGLTHQNSYEAPGQARYGDSLGLACPGGNKNGREAVTYFIATCIRRTVILAVAV